MKPRKRPIKNLFFRWGRAFGLEGPEVARLLEGAGLITLEPLDRYLETERALSMAPEDFETCINIILGKAQDEKFNR